MQVQLATRAVGVFDKQDQAVAAVRALLAAGFPPGKIVIVASNWQGHDISGPRVELQQASARGAVRGAIVGGCLGAAAGMLASLIPGAGWNTFIFGVIGGAVGAAIGCYVGPFIALE